MTYEQWIRKFGQIILEEGAEIAAAVAGVPRSYANRHRKVTEARDKIARQMGGASRFYLYCKDAKA